MRCTGAAADYNDFAVAAGIVPVMNDGVSHVICLFGIMTVIADEVLPWKRMRRTVHLEVRRREAIFNRYTQESVMREPLGDASLHLAGFVATFVNHDHYAMSLPVVDVYTVARMFMPLTPL